MANMCESLLTGTLTMEASHNAFAYTNIDRLFKLCNASWERVL